MIAGLDGPRDHVTEGEGETRHQPASRPPRTSRCGAGSPTLCISGLPQTGRSRLRSARDPRPHSAYAFGSRTLPDVYVWATNGDFDLPPIRHIFYGSRDRWVVTTTQLEFRGDCFEEEE